MSKTPFELLEEVPNVHTRAADMKRLMGKTIQIVGYLVHIKRTQTRTDDPQRMSFGTWLDLDGEWLDTVHFPQSAARSPFQGPGCYLITGKVIDDFGFISIEALQIERLPNMNMETPSVRLRSSESYFKNEKKPLQLQ